MNGENLKITLPSGLSFEMIFVEEGEFTMGGGRTVEESEVSTYSIKVNSFYIAKYLLTQDIWEEVMGGNPSRFRGKKHPVNKVSSSKAKAFIRKLNEITGKDFRLPSSAEWVYAAKGGKYSQGFSYAGSDKLKQVGWYNENSNGEIKEVGLLSPNELGLYDMSGNVWEWCETDDHNRFLGVPSHFNILLDESEPLPMYVARGGGYFTPESMCHFTPGGAQVHGNLTDDYGFRLVLPIQ